MLEHLLPTPMRPDFFYLNKFFIGFFFYTAIKILIYKEEHFSLEKIMFFI